MDEDKDLFFMKEALKQAQKAFKANEVPVGAILVFQDKVIAKAYNQVELLKDATAHAEMLCLTMGSSSLENWRLLDTTLYCTLEPCVMCCGALILSRVKRLVWGAPDLRHGGGGSWVNLFEKKHPIHTVEVKGGVMQEECADLLQEFFRQRRQKNLKDHEE